MKCEEIRDRMPEVAAGFGEFTTDESNHLANCAECTEHLKAIRATMSVLDEWQVPEPSPYFDVRLQARLREEMAKPHGGWLHWLRRPVLAASLTVMMGIGIGVFMVMNGKDSGKKDVPTANVSVQADPGSAVGDLQTLDKNDDMYANFELLDDLDLQQNVDETPQNADN